MSSKSSTSALSARVAPPTAPPIRNTFPSRSWTAPPTPRNPATTLGSPLALTIVPMLSRRSLVALFRFLIGAVRTSRRLLIAWIFAVALSTVLMTIDSGTFLSAMAFVDPLRSFAPENQIVDVERHQCIRRETEGLRDDGYRVLPPRHAP